MLCRIIRHIFSGTFGDARHRLSSLYRISKNRTTVFLIPVLLQYNRPAGKMRKPSNVPYVIFSLAALPQCLIIHNRNIHSVTDVCNCIIELVSFFLCMSDTVFPVKHFIDDSQTVFICLLLLLRCGIDVSFFFDNVDVILFNYLLLKLLRRKQKNPRHFGKIHFYTFHILRYQHFQTCLLQRHQRKTPAAVFVVFYLQRRNHISRFCLIDQKTSSHIFIHIRNNIYQHMSIKNAVCLFRIIRQMNLSSF